MKKRLLFCRGLLHYPPSLLVSIKFVELLLHTVSMFYLLLRFAIIPAAEKLGSGYTDNIEHDEDPLLDAMSVLELNADLACHSLATAREALTRMCKHFFPKPLKIPSALEGLGNLFLTKEEPALIYRWNATRTGIEATIALVNHSRQVVNWEMVTTAKGLTGASLTALLKEAKKFSRAILNKVDPSSKATPSATASGATTRTEVQ